MKKEFASLYDLMANQRDVKFMRVFGGVHKEMFDWFVANKPDLAQEWLDKLEAIKWHQYLTRKEAENIIARMKPDAPWKYDVWRAAMAKLGIPTEEQPYYNQYALWTEMDKQYSDHAETIATKIIKKPLASIPAEDIVPGIYAMAVDVLKDRDGIYDIRAYFGL